MKKNKEASKQEDAASTRMLTPAFIITVSHGSDAPSTHETRRPANGVRTNKFGLEHGVGQPPSRGVLIRLANLHRPMFSVERISLH